MQSRKVAASVLASSGAFVHRSVLGREAALLAAEIPDADIAGRFARLEAMASP